MSQRLPTPGGDSGTWGDVLNAYLGVSHAADGTMNAGVVGATVLSSGAASAGQVATATGWGSVTYASVSNLQDKLGLTPTVVKNVGYTAVAGDFVPVDTTAGSITITLPNAPADGSVVAVKHVIQASTNSVVLATAGSDVFNKASGPTGGTLLLVNQGAVFQYKTSSAIWYSVATDTPLSGLDSRYAASTYAIDTIGSGTDITTNNVSSSKHGLAPKSPADATKFLNGATTPAYAQPKDSDLAFTDITTNNSTTGQHGFLPKLDSSSSKAFLGDGTYNFAPYYSTNAQTNSYTAVLTDHGKIVEITAAAGVTFTVPTNASVAFPVGSVIAVSQFGAGQITFAAASGATIVCASSHTKTNVQYSAVVLRKQATDNWLMAGDTA